MPNRINLNAVWDDAKTLGRGNRDLLIAIAGMFVLLPSLLADQVIVPTEVAEQATSMAEVMTRMSAYVEANWPVLLAHSLVTSFGTLAMLSLLLRPERPTVAESLKAALVILPAFFFANLMARVGIVLAGVFLLVLPGLYLAGRLALIGSIASAERCTNPIELINRSVALTRGNGWRIVVLLAILTVATMVIWLLTAVLVRLIGALFFSDELAALALSLLDGTIEAGMTIIMVLISAAIYRAVTARPMA